MPSRGWSGNAPATDEEAIDRILDVADAIIAERGSAVRIADVARTLGVTRQTVYRYFPNTEELLLASGMRTADGFLDQLAEHTSGLTEPAEALVEGIAFAVETLADDPQFANLLRNGSKSGSTVSLTSDTAKAFSRSMLHRCESIGSATVSTKKRSTSWASWVCVRFTRYSSTPASPPVTVMRCAASSPDGWARPSCTRG